MGDKAQISDEHVNKILKYIYNNQDFKAIKKEINETNISAFYSQAFVMKCTNLLLSLDDMIIHELLTPQNSSLFYLDAIRFDNKKIEIACEQLLQQYIDEILKTDKGTSFLLSLPYAKMLSLCSKSSLSVSDEKKLVDLFAKYIKHRETIKPLLPEEDPWLDWSHLSDAEKEGREKAKVEAATKNAAAKEELAKAKETEFAALDPLGQENKKWENEVAKVAAKASGNLKLCRLTKAEKKELFKTIRYSYMKHEDLLALTADPVFALAKEYIIQGLSVRLNPYENGIKE